MQPAARPPLRPGRSGFPRRTRTEITSARSNDLKRHAAKRRRISARSRARSQQTRAGISQQERAGHPRVGPPPDSNTRLLLGESVGARDIRRRRRHSWWSRRGRMRAAAASARWSVSRPRAARRLSGLQCSSPMRQIPQGCLVGGFTAAADVMRLRMCTTGARRIRRRVGPVRPNAAPRRPRGPFARPRRIAETRGGRPKRLCVEAFGGAEIFRLDHKFADPRGAGWASSLPFGASRRPTPPL